MTRFQNGSTAPERLPTSFRNFLRRDGLNQCVKMKLTTPPRPSPIGWGMCSRGRDIAPMSPPGSSGRKQGSERVLPGQSIASCTRRGQRGAPSTPLSTYGWERVSRTDKLIPFNLKAIWTNCALMRPCPRPAETPKRTSRHLAGPTGAVAAKRFVQAGMQVVLEQGDWPVLQSSRGSSDFGSRQPVLVRQLNRRQAPPIIRSTIRLRHFRGSL